MWSFININVVGFKFQQTGIDTILIVFKILFKFSEMVKDGKMFKAKNRKHKQDARHLKAAISAMPKPVHPKKGSQVPSKPPIMDTDGSEAESVPVENIFAQKLASNDSTMRNRAVKKLKKWLEARSSSESDPFTEVLFF